MIVSPVRTLSVLTVAALSCPFGKLDGVSAQEVLKWSDFETCIRCEIRLSEVIRLGDADGDGIVESENEGVSWSEETGWLVYRTAGTTVKLFAEDGQFVRLFGGPGQGPGEFDSSISDAHAVGGEILVNDFRKRAFVAFSPSGEYLDERRYGFKTGSFVQAGSGRVVVFSMDRTPELVGYPIHLVEVASGRTSSRFGMDYPNEWSGREPWADVIVGSVVSGHGTLWWGNPSSATIHEWSVDGEHLMTVEGELPWLPRMASALTIRSPARAPEPRLAAIAADQNGNVWLLSLQPDPEWREVPRQGPEGGVLQSDRSDFLDTRLDVFDLAERRHLGSYVWDTASVRLLAYKGGPAVSLVDDEGPVPQIVVYGVDWYGEPRF